MVLFHKHNIPITDIKTREMTASASDVETEILKKKKIHMNTSFTGY